MKAELPPPHLPGFDYIDELGAGGHADVFLYRQHTPNRKVAIKVLRESASTAEADAMAEVTHENIVPIFDCVVAPDERLCLVMAYYPGPTFDERYQEEVLSVEEVLSTGVKLCGALATAHSASILHRDIKPSNILTSQFNEPGLTDFGIAVSSSGEHIQEGASLPWAPPEVLERRRPTQSADVYGVAVTLFTLLEGHPPYWSASESNDDIPLVKRTLMDNVPTLTRADAPASLRRLLQLGMARDPERRVGTAEEFGRELQKIETERGLAATPLRTPVTYRPEKSGRRDRDLRDDPGRTNIQLPSVVDPDVSADDHGTIARLDQKSPLDRQRRGADAARLDPPDTRRTKSVPGDGTGRVGPAPSDGSSRSGSAAGPPSRLGVGAPPSSTESRTRRRVAATPAEGSGPNPSTRWVWLAGTGAALAAVIVIAATLFGGSEPGRDEDGSRIVTTLPTVPLARVTGLTMTESGPDSVEVSWKGPARLDGGHFNWSRCDAGDPTTHSTADETISLSDLQPGTRVCVQVSFQASDGNESDEEQVEITNLGATP